MGQIFFLKLACTIYSLHRNIVKNNWSCILSLFIIIFLHEEINSHYVKNIAALAVVYLGCKVRKCSSGSASQWHELLLFTFPFDLQLIKQPLWSKKALLHRVPGHARHPSICASESVWIGLLRRWQSEGDGGWAGGRGNDGRECGRRVR